MADGRRHGDSVESDRLGRGLDRRRCMVAVRRRTGALAGIASLTLLAACGSASFGASPVHQAPDAGTTSPVFYRAPAPLPLEPPGSVIRAQALAAGAGLPAGATAYRVLYHSQTLSGGDVAVSGMVVVPGGRRPVGGFPILAWAHGTTGTAAGCAPSLEGIASLPALGTMLGDGFIVAATDYQGLGVDDGTSPYLIGTAEAQDVLDGARAARELVGQAASNEVVVLGHSQGGQAALFAGQIAPSYAPELFVAGVVAAAPVTSIFELAPRSTEQPAGDGAAYLVMALDSWEAAYGNLPDGGLLTASGEERLRAAAVGCEPAVATAFAGEPAASFLAPGWRSDPALLADAALNRPGQAPIAAPLLVVQGTADRLVPAATTAAFVRDQLCGAAGDDVEELVEHGADHTDILGAALPAVLQWFEQRLFGVAAAPGCPGPAVR